jgi:hypothetical protein
VTADEHARFAAWLLARGYAPRTVEKFVRDATYVLAAGATTADEVDAVFCRALAARRANLRAAARVYGEYREAVA